MGGCVYPCDFFNFNFFAVEEKSVVSRLHIGHSYNY